MAFIRKSLLEANPWLDPQELDQRLVLELARLAASPSFRDLLAQHAGSISELYLTPLEVDSGLGSLQARGFTWLIEVNGESLLYRPWERSLDALQCSDDAYGGSCETAPGDRGFGGPGGEGREKRCSGFAVSGKVCIQNGDIDDCRMDRGYALYLCQRSVVFPDPLQLECPAFYTEVEPTDIRPAGIPAVVGGWCPSTLAHEIGGVFCKPRGESGSRAAKYELSAWEFSRATAWTYNDWTEALDLLQPAEIERRVGRANTMYKRGQELEAVARYYSAVTMTLAPPSFCPNVGEPCTLCQDVPDPTELQTRWCLIRDSAGYKLRQIRDGVNFYGYLPNYVPPPSVLVQASDVQWDLVSEVEQQLGDAIDQRTLWLNIGNAKEIESFQLQEGLLRLNSEYDMLSQVTLPVLSAQQALADQRISDAFDRIRELQEVIEQLQQERVELTTPDGFTFELNIGDFVKVTLAAVATAYGGPAAGALALGIWNRVEDTVEEAKQKRDRPPPQQEVWMYDGCAYHVSKSPADSEKRPDCNKKFTEELFKGLQEEVVEDEGKEFLEYLADYVGLGEPSSPDALSLAVIDAQIRELTLEAHDAGAEFGQANLERSVVREQYQGAQWQRARIAQDRQILQRFPSQPDTLPPPEVQLRMAELAFQYSAHLVDRAGETFFLLRRAVEREAVPFDPVTDENYVATREQQEVLNVFPACESVQSGSLDVNLSTIECYSEWTNHLEREYALIRQSRAIHALEFAVDASDWVLGVDEDGNATYFFALNIGFEDLLDDSVSRGDIKQRLYTLGLYLETDSSEQVAVPIALSRSPESPDVYFLGYAGEIPQFTKFDVGQADLEIGSSLLSLLLRDRTRYAHWVYACNAMTPSDPSSPTHDLCRLENLSVSGRAFLEGRSLIGTTEFALRQQDLEGKTPTRLVVDVRYQHE